MRKLEEVGGEMTVDLVMVQKKQGLRAFPCIEPK